MHQKNPCREALLITLGATSWLALSLFSACGSDSGGRSQTGGTVMSPLPSGGGSSSPSASPSSSSSPVSFSAVNVILKASCDGAACHGAGATNRIMVDNQTNVDGDKAAIKSDVQTDRMPPGGGMSDEDKQTIIDYCSQ